LGFFCLQIFDPNSRPHDCDKTFQVFSECQAGLHRPICNVYLDLELVLLAEAAPLADEDDVAGVVVADAADAPEADEVEVADAADAPDPEEAEDELEAAAAAALVVEAEEVAALTLAAGVLAGAPVTSRHPCSMLMVCSL
jgi:hypothetical protein